MVQKRIAEEKKRLTRKTIYKLKVSLWKNHNTFHSVDDKLADLFSMENKSLFNQPEVSLYHVIKPMKCAVETRLHLLHKAGNSSQNQTETLWV